MTDEFDVDDKNVILSKRLRVEELNAELSYTLLKREIQDEECGIRESYTLVCRYDDETAVLPDITSLRQRAEEIFALFLKNSVTPTSAFDIIEEMI